MTEQPFDYVGLCREMAHLSHRAAEEASRPGVSARERRLLRRQARAAEKAAGLYGRAAGCRSEREAVLLLAKALRHQKRFLDLADELVGGV
ncbi:hypothetical protein [Sinomonas humi]|uniref:Uncharacterized protein n=1 Tax=Sinomonas humi TaxID=1338436 RepID=A0A0B2AF80_9MICC|nr:hypothetical protein [Sinomonas humi]KHL00426.1 hypothetical protein LK10_19635 [Sinomonas humi]